MSEENRSFPPRRRRRRSKPHRLLKAFAVILPLALVLIIAAVLLYPKPGFDDPQLSGTSEVTTAPTTQPTAAPTTEPTAEATTEPTTAPTEPPIEKIATATLGATGDILLHDRVIAGGLDSTTGLYNYDNIFTYFAKYVEQTDYSVGNMEGTLCGNDNGYSYSGYPCFNAPDAIVDATQKAGFDMLLTANNHSYDTGHTGFLRTQEVISDRGLAHIGTRPTLDTQNYLIEDINGIQVGMTCYTYETGKNGYGNKTLNGIGLRAEDCPLVNTFDYQDLDTFYQQLGSEIAAMKAAGAECTVLFIHWGYEYITTPNSYQTEMAQAICNLGVDVIIGGHPHVVQPIAVLTGETDTEHTTLCLYSMGNSVSNIRASKTKPVHTEDGMLFTLTLAKYSDGSVVIEGADILSTWVNRYTSAETGREVFAIIPLDPQVEDWKTAYDLSDYTLTLAENSLQRSQEILAEGLANANEFYRQKQLAHEIELGIQ